MPRIYFEKQVAAMCGQHLLNNLLQGNYFDASSLSNIALTLDQHERELGLAVDASRHQSQNVDASGNFSIQVLEVALEESFNIKLNRDEGEVRRALRTIDNITEPESAIEQIAFVFNSHNHWFAARWLHREFWVLNSMEEAPNPISRTMLSMFVQQMREEGWSVFVTKGRLPAATNYEEGENWYLYGADAINKKEEKKPKVVAFQGKGHSLKEAGVEVDGSEDPELLSAIKASMLEYDASPPDAKLDDEPAKDASAVIVQLVLPGAGKKVRRRFKPEAKTEQIFLWAKTFPEVSGGALQSIQKAEDRMDIQKGEAISSLGNACSLRAVMF